MKRIILFCAFATCSAQGGTEARTLGRLLSQCRIGLQNSVARFWPSARPEVTELNQWINSNKYQADSITFVGPHIVEGKITRKFVEADSIEVDGVVIPTNNRVYKIVKRNREDGIKEIAHATRRTQNEHSWVYVPSRELWIDTTFGTTERSVYQDPIVIEALQEKFGNVEFFHSHPEPLTSDVNAERRFPMSSLISGALPTGSDLDALNGMAWNSDRSIPKVAGIIHPLGVTYYMPTRKLLTSGAGAVATDIGTLHTEDISSLSPVEAIHRLVTIQEERNRIHMHEDDPAYAAFKIKFFPLEDLSGAADWISKNSTSLTKEEAERYRR